jgi:hypothetical protein
MWSRATAALTLLSLVACSSATVPDAGDPDAAVRPDAAAAPDAAARTDAAVAPDTGDTNDAAQAEDAQAPVDADARDATAADAVAADALAGDADPPRDAEPSDAAEPDAQPLDATSADAAALPTGCSPAPLYTAPTPAAAGIPAASLVAWVRADLGLSLDGSGRVCAADDLSGLGHHFVQVVPGSRPTVGTLGGQVALAVVGAQWLEREDLLGIVATSSRTVVAVLELDAPAARSTPLSQGDPATNDDYLGPDINTFNTGGSRWGAYMTGNAYDGQLATGVDPVIQVWRIDSMTIGAPVLAHLSARINAVPLVLTRTPAGSGNGTIEDFAGARRTWLPYPRATQDYQLAEVLVWSRALSLAEIAQVEAYLATRYGIAL